MDAKSWAIAVYRSGLLGIIGEGAGVDLHLFGEAARQLGEKKCQLVSLAVAKEFELDLDRASSMISAAHRETH